MFKQHHWEMNTEECLDNEVKIKKGSKKKNSLPILTVYLNCVP